MKNPTPTSSTLPQPNYHKWVLVLLLAVGLVRLVGLIVSPLNLHGDEAQYWAWSRQFDWGYFSKPPMIAWVIGITTAIFGNAEWAVRISSPLLHPIIAYVLFRTGQFIYDARTGFWAAAVYFLMPAVWLSSGIVSTDVPLLLCWALALNTFAHLRETGSMKWAVMLGLAIGFGMLSKYAMLFFLPALGLCILIDAPTRRALFSLKGLIVAAIVLAVLAPNIWWNANNNFATLTHTAANANLKQDIFHPLELLEFWGSQFGVIGPVLIILLVMGLVSAFRHKSRKIKGEKWDVLLALFVLSPLLVISLEALLSRANANWAVTAYGTGAIVVARYGVLYWPRVLKSGIWINVFLGAVLSIGTLAPSIADKIGQANAFKRLRGWPQTQSLVTETVKQGHDGQAFQTIATDNRLVFYDLLYYGIERETGLPLRMWLHTSHTNNHAEATAPLAPSIPTDAPVLVINYYRDYDKKFAEDFDSVDYIKTVNIDLGGGKTRSLKLWAGYGYTPTNKADR